MLQVAYGCYLFAGVYVLFTGVISLLPLDTGTAGAIGLLVLVPLAIATLAALGTGIVITILRRTLGLVGLSGATILFFAAFALTESKSVLSPRMAANFQQAAGLLYGLVATGVPCWWCIAGRHRTNRRS
jgi:hypothetical protein